MPSLAKPVSSAVFSIVNFIFFQAGNARKTTRAAGRNLRRVWICVNDKAADTVGVHAAALPCPRIIRGTFPPLAEKPEREKTDATSPKR